METGDRITPIQTIAVRVGSSIALTLLVATGLLMVPVSCMCGSSVPHAHSLFQLRSHHHKSVEAPDEGMNNGGHAMEDSSTMMTSMHAAHGGPSSDTLPATDSNNTNHYALSNAMEKQDGAVVQAPPSSSIGHPMAMTQPAMITLGDQQSEPLTLPAVLTMTGLEQSPETPPPRALAMI